MKLNGSSPDGCYELQNIQMYRMYAVVFFDFPFRHALLLDVAVKSGYLHTRNGTRTSDSQTPYVVLLKQLLQSWTQTVV